MQSAFIRPTAPNGTELSTIEEISALTGLSIDHLRERTRPNGRGGRLEAIKIGRRLWFDKERTISAIYAARSRKLGGDILSGLI